MAQSLRPFGESRMLPRAAYVDPAVFEWEKRHMFGGGWVYVGRSDQVASPGDMRAESLGTGGVLLSRDEDGVLHAFANTCRHRGHELLPCGASAAAQGDHLPVSRLDLRAERRPAGGGGLQEPPGLRDRRVGPARAAGHRVARPGVRGRVGHGRPARGLPGHAWRNTSRRTRWSGWWWPGSTTTTSTANWKILTENYHECYHCPSIHPQLCKVSPPKSGENYSAPGIWVGGWMDLRDGMATMSLDGSSSGAPLRGLDATGLRTVIYVGIFPNLLLSLHPDYVMMHRMIPLAAEPDQDRVHLGLRPGVAGPARIRPRVCDRVLGHHQPAGLAGVRVGAARAQPPRTPCPGPLSPDEDAVYQFVTMVARGYQGERAWTLGVPEPAR